MALKKLNWIKYLFVNQTEAQTEQRYWNEKRKKHLKSEHSVGVVHGLNVIQTPMPSLGVLVHPGRGLDGQGNDPEVESLLEIDCSALIPSTGEQLVYIILSYTENEIEAYFVNEINDMQNKYIQDGVKIEVRTSEPQVHEIELARILLTSGTKKIRDAIEVKEPQVNEINLNFRHYSGKEVLNLKDLADVDENEANAFNAMNDPSLDNPIATFKDVDNQLSPVRDEVITARGTTPKLGNRLDVMLNNDGSFKGITQIESAFPLQGGGDKGKVSLGISEATPAASGSMPAKDKEKLNGIEWGATADMSVQEIVNLLAASRLLQLSMLGDVSVNEAAAFNAAGAVGASAGNRYALISDLKIQQAVYA